MNNHTLSCSFGFVNFKNLSDAVRAKREMEGKPLATSIKLSIQFTKARQVYLLHLRLSTQASNAAFPYYTRCLSLS
jgi:hypothetical protein